MGATGVNQNQLPRDRKSVVVVQCRVLILIVERRQIRNQRRASGGYRQHIRISTCHHRRTSGYLTNHPEMSRITFPICRHSSNGARAWLVLPLLADALAYLSLAVVSLSRDISCIWAGLPTQRLSITGVTNLEEFPLIEVLRYSTLNSGHS